MKKRINIAFYEEDIQVLLNALGNYQQTARSTQQRNIIGYVINRVYRALGARID